MRRSLAKFSESEASNHAPSWADFITATPAFKLSVHTSKPRREVFQDESTEAMTASLRSATLKGCAAASRSANKGLKIFVRTRRRNVCAVNVRAFPQCFSAQMLSFPPSRNEVFLPGKPFQGVASAEADLPNVKP